MGAWKSLLSHFWVTLILSGFLGVCRAGSTPTSQLWRLYVHNVETQSWLGKTLFLEPLFGSPEWFEVSFCLVILAWSHREWLKPLLMTSLLVAIRYTWPFPVLISIGQYLLTRLQLVQILI